MKEKTNEIKNNTNNTISVSVGNEEYEPEPRGDFHDFDEEPPEQIGISEPLVYKTESLLELILEELIQIRNKLN